MSHPFGQTLKINLLPAQPWLRLGPGWAVLAGALSTGRLQFTLPVLLQLLSLWVLVDSLLGMLWDLSVGQGLWRKIVTAQLGPAPDRGFSIPYVQPDSMAGRFVLQIRRYQFWWRECYWAENRSAFVSFWLGTILALLIALFLAPTVFWLTLLAIFLIMLAGQLSNDLSTPYGGRLQSLVQFLLPWSMGMAAWSLFTPLGLMLAVCYWVTYLGGLRMLGRHHRAEILFFGGQAVAIVLLLALRLLPGAAILSVLLIAQWLVKLKFNRADEFLQKVRLFLVAAVMVAGFSLGSIQ